MNKNKSKSKNNAIIEKAATAIANMRGGRRGVPPIDNVLDILPEKVRLEILEDAEAVLQAIGESE